MGATEITLNTLPEAADRWRLSRSQIYRMINDGSIEVVRIGGRTFIPEDEIVRVIREGRRRGGAP